MPINHIVLSGGGPAGLATYGTMSELNKSKVWNLPDIKTIYACSVGAFMGAVFALDYEWDWLDDYFIKRPWNKLINIDPTNILGTFSSKGLIDISTVKKALEPLLEAKNLDVNLTMEDFYKHTGIELHIFAVNINNLKLEKVNISYKSHPEMKLVTAIGASMAIPVLFTPVFYKNSCFIDGGLLNNFPVNDCIQETLCDKSEILALNYDWLRGNNVVTEESTLLEYLAIFIRRCEKTLSTENIQTELPNIITTKMEGYDGFNIWIDTLSSEEERNKLVLHGIESAKTYITRNADNRDDVNNIDDADNINKVLENSEYYKYVNTSPDGGC